MLLLSARLLLVVLPLTLLMGPAVAEVISIVISLLFLVHSARSRDWQWTKSPWVRLLFFVTVMFVISGLASADPATSAQRGALFLRFPLFAAALAFWVARDDRTQRAMLASMVIAGLFLAVDMFVQYVRGYDLFGVGSLVLDHFVRLNGPFNNPHGGSTLAWLTVPSLFFLVYLVGRVFTMKSLRFAGYGLAMVLSAFLLAMVYISGERAAFLGCLLALVLAMVLARPVRAYFMVFAALLGLVMGAAVHHNPLVLEMQFTRTARDVTNFAESAYGRLWGSALAISADKPLLGVGSKQFRHACLDEKYGPVGTSIYDTRCGMHPHNIYLEILAETGVVSLLLFLAVLGYWARLAWQHRRAIMADPLLCGLCIAVVVRLWPLASTPSLVTPWFATPMWLVIGVALARLAMAPTHAPRA